MPSLSPTVLVVLFTAEDTAGGSAGSFSRFRYLCMHKHSMSYCMLDVHAGQPHCVP
jgi:hypothetical protein